MSSGRRRATPGLAAAASLLAIAGCCSEEWSSFFRGAADAASPDLKAAETSTGAPDATDPRSGAGVPITRPSYPLTVVLQSEPGCYPRPNGSVTLVPGDLLCRLQSGMSVDAPCARDYEANSEVTITAAVMNKPGTVVTRFVGFSGCGLKGTTSGNVLLADTCTVILTAPTLVTAHFCLGGSASDGGSGPTGGGDGGTTSP